MISEQTIISTAAHATAKDPSYFFLPDGFHPERWLNADHPLYDARFAGDVKEASKPFSLGPRWCIGSHLAYSGSLSWTKVILNSLIMAKLAWNFDWKFGSANDVDFKRDARLLGLWRPPPLRVCYTPVVREDEE